MPEQLFDHVPGPCRTRGQTAQSEPSSAQKDGQTVPGCSSPVPWSTSPGGVLFSAVSSCFCLFAARCRVDQGEAQASELDGLPRRAVQQRS